MKKNNIIYTEKRTVSCSNDKNSIQHPKVFLKLIKNEKTNKFEVKCPYCSNHFILKD